MGSALRLRTVADRAHGGRARGPALSAELGGLGEVERATVPALPLNSSANAASRIRSWSSAAGRPGRRSRASDIASSSVGNGSLRATRELRDVTAKSLGADL